MKMLRSAGIALLMGLLATTAACGSDDDGDSAAGGGGDAKVTVEKQWARTSPSGATNGAVYMTLESAEGDTLTAASVDKAVAAKTEIHETMAAAAEGSSTTKAGAMGGGAGGDMMSMKPVEKIELPKGEAVELKPGGYHIMLLDLAVPLETGKSIKVTLTFTKAGAQIVDVPVRDSAP